MSNSQHVAKPDIHLHMLLHQLHHIFLPMSHTLSPRLSMHAWPSANSVTAGTSGGSYTQGSSSLLLPFGAFHGSGAVACSLHSTTVQYSQSLLGSYLFV